MGQSKYSKTQRAIRRVATAVGVGGATSRIPLNRDFLLAEHRVNIGVSQGHTNAPTSIDVRDFISTVSVESSDGRRIFLTGAQAYDLGRFTEAAALVTSTFVGAGLSTAGYSFDLHYSNDAALLDMLTALRSNELSSLDLVVQWAPDAANGFKGGTVPLVATYNVEVESEEYEMLNEEQFGSKLGVFKHFAEKQEVTGTSIGTQADFQLVTGNATRFLMLHTYDTSGAVPVLSDAILGPDLRLNINGRDWRVVSAASIRRDNTALRSFNQVGVYCIDFSDDERGFLSLEKVQQAKLAWTTATGAPAWHVTLAQDYTKNPKI